MNNILDVVENKKCVGCFNCFNSCSSKAIQIANVNGCLEPIIDNNKCINCSLCRKKCPVLNAKNTNEPLHSFVGFCRSDIASKSSSGGIASAIAEKVISLGGGVYGASLFFQNDKIVSEHIFIDNVDDIKKIQGSKYVQSDVSSAIIECSSRVKSGKLTCFIGTSCQVEALKAMLNYQKYDNLLLVDLVCHGVPKNDLFYDYISFIERKYKGKVIDVSFREKAIKNQETNNYVLNFSINKDGQIINKRIGLRNSAFYRMYMLRSGYRPSCYNCLFANIHKPSDITLGDYYKYKSDKFGPKDHLSLILIHTEKGKNIFDSLNDINYESVEINNVLKSHEQLVEPSSIGKEGIKIQGIYQSGGFKKVQRYINYKNLITVLPSLLKKMIKKIRK